MQTEIQMERQIGHHRRKLLVWLREYLSVCHGHVLVHQALY